MERNGERTKYVGVLPESRGFPCPSERLGQQRETHESPRPGREERDRRGTPAGDAARDRRESDGSVARYIRPPFTAFAVPHPGGPFAELVASSSVGRAQERLHTPGSPGAAVPAGRRGQRPERHRTDLLDELCAEEGSTGAAGAPSSHSGTSGPKPTRRQGRPATPRYSADEREHSAPGAPEGHAHGV